MYRRPDHSRTLLSYALSVACRPFNALYALPLFTAYLTINRRAGKTVKAMARALVPGVCLGLCVAFGIGMYNYVRFGNPLEFGHNYLPEFSFQGGIQFSIDHVAKNLKRFLWGLPVNSEGEVEKFGYSMLIACPTLVLMLYWFMEDLFRRRMRVEKIVVLLTCIANAFLLLLHRTFGGYQLGARYAVDLVPYTFFYLLLTPEKKRSNVAELLILLAVLGFTAWAATIVHL